VDQVARDVGYAVLGLAVFFGVAWIWHVTRTLRKDALDTLAVRFWEWRETRPKRCAACGCRGRLGSPLAARPGQLAMVRMPTGAVFCEDCWDRYRAAVDAARERVRPPS
jgi:hypothetical protein